MSARRSLTRLVSSAVVALLAFAGVVVLAAPAQAVTPVAYGDTYGGPIGGSIEVPAPGILSNDVASAGYEVLVVDEEGLWSGSVLRVNADGAFTLDLPGGIDGRQSFSYCLSSGGTCVSNVAQTRIHVGSPYLRSQSYQTREGQTLTIPSSEGLLAGAGNLSGETPHVLSSRGGTLDVASDGAFEFTPEPGFTGRALFEYCLYVDGGCADEVNALVSIAVYPSVDDQSVTVALGSSVDGTLYPAPSDQISHVGLVTSSPTHGNLDIANNGTFTYNPGASYSGSDSFTFCISTDGAACVQGSEPATVSITTEQTEISTTTWLTGPSTVYFGEDLTLTAIVDPAPNGGTVSFSVLGETVSGCSAVPVQDGTATCTIPQPPVGTEVYDGNFSGTPEFSPSSGDTIVTVHKALARLLYTGPETTTVGEPSELSVHLFGPTADLTGEEVSLSFDGQNCSGAVDAMGNFSCTLTPTTAGMVELTASYAGSSTVEATTLTQDIDVAQQTSTTTLTVDNDSPAWGVPVTFTATVPDDASGTVAFATVAGALDGCDAVAITDGEATCSSSFDVGVHEVSAEYSGDDTYASSRGSLDVEAVPHATTLTITGPAELTVDRAGQPTMSLVDNVTGEPVTGVTVSLDTGDDSCEGTLTEAGTACEVTPSAAGTMDLSAEFAGTDRYLGDAATGSIDVRPAPTGIVMGAPGAVPFASTARFTARVAPTDGSGTMTFHSDGEAIEGCIDMPLVEGLEGWEAACFTNSMPAGERRITVDYSGTDNYAPATSGTVVLVTPAETRLSYDGDTEGTVGGDLTAAATVEYRADGEWLPLEDAPVEFLLDIEECAGITDGDGRAACLLSPTAVAQSGEILASFSGTDEYAAASGVGTVTVAAADTETNLTATPGGAYPAAVTLAATVSPTDGNGTVGFTADGEPIEECADVVLTEGEGGWQAICEITPSAAGPHEYGATFSGTEDYLTSSATASANLDKAPVTLVALGPDTATVDEPVMVSVLLAAPAEGAAAGDRAQFAVPTEIIGGGDVAELDLSGQTVTFTFGDQTCTGLTDADGRAECEFTPISDGDVNLTAVFDGTGDLASAEASVTVSVAAADNESPAPDDPTPPTTGEDSPGLPDTGTDITAAVALALTTILLGGMLLVAARRRQSA